MQNLQHFGDMGPRKPTGKNWQPHCIVLRQNHRHVQISFASIIFHSVVRRTGIKTCSMFCITRSDGVVFLISSSQFISALPIYKLEIDPCELSILGFLKGLKAWQLSCIHKHWPLHCRWTWDGMGWHGYLPSSEARGLPQWRGHWGHWHQERGGLVGRAMSETMPFVWRHRGSPSNRWGTRSPAQVGDFVSPSRWQLVEFASAVSKAWDVYRRCSHLGASGDDFLAFWTFDNVGLVLGLVRDVGKGWVMVGLWFSHGWSMGSSWWKLISFLTKRIISWGSAPGGRHAP